MNFTNELILIHLEKFQTLRYLRDGRFKDTCALSKYNDQNKVICTSRDTAAAAGLELFTLRSNILYICYIPKIGILYLYVVVKRGRHNKLSQHYLYIKR